MTSVVMFPGQGSQQIGMGEYLFDIYKEKVEEASDTFGYDLKKTCLEGPIELLGRTDVTQAVIFVVNALSYMEWSSKNTKPDVLLGHSIGQYNAMVAADMISYSDCLRLVKRRGQLMVKLMGGAMAVVMKLSSEEVICVLKKIPGGDEIDMANFNSEYQTVISSTINNIDSVITYFQDAGAVVVKLNTSGAFHSRYMKLSKSEYRNFLEGFDFHLPSSQVICNVTARDIIHTKEALSQHLISPVLWYQSIYKILEQDFGAVFTECGWGQTLSNILRYNRKEYQKC